MNTSNRHTTTQPTYDFLAGGNVDSSPQVKNPSFRQSQATRPEAGNNEDLRAQINSLRYELENTHQERGLLILQHEKELRDVQLKADADFKKYQAAEGASEKASRKYEGLAQQLRDAQTQAVNEKAGQEKKIRDLQEANQSLREDAADIQAQLSDQERRSLHQINDIEAKRAALQDTVDHLKHDLQRVSQDLEATQTRLNKRDADVEALEGQLVQFKSRSGDNDSLGVLQRELSQQVSHISRLESTNREQLAELKRLRSAHRSVEVVEEQKRSLETELQVLQDVHRQLGEAQIQREVLEDEKRTWSSLLGQEGHDLGIHTPEAVVKALVQERIERASLFDRVGKLEADVAGKDRTIAALDAANTALKQTRNEPKVEWEHGSTDASHSKAFKRMERQRVLAVKEVEYLRAQLKTFDTEETVLMSNENFDAQRAEQIKHLESVVDQYRSEIQSLHQELSQRESTPCVEPSEPRGTKRALSASVDSEDPQLGSLLRKVKNLQSTLSEATTKIKMLETELQASKCQVKTLTSRSRTRILELRSNPTSNDEAVKLSSLKTLRTENAALLSQLRGEDLSNVPVVPAATVDNLTLQLSKLQAEVASGQKQTRRLREIFGSKATEFREAVASILGYKINFLPNGKAKITSAYYVRGGMRGEEGGGGGGGGGTATAAAARSGGADAGGVEEADEADEAEQEEQENNHSIIFDGEEGTMKFSGGANSSFALAMRELVTFWVQERRSVPCFLAAMTLELFEKSLRAEAGVQE